MTSSLLYFCNTYTISAGTRIHQQVRKGITKREPALKTAIRKFNSYCDTLRDLVGNSNTPTPHHLPTKLAILREDPYLMEDVWIHSVTEAPPLWLTEAPVRKGIRGMLKIDRCEEEQKRLGIEADRMCAWFGRELAAVTVALYSPDSKLDFSDWIITYILIAHVVKTLTLDCNSNGGMMTFYASSTSGRHPSYPTYHMHHM